MRWAEVHHCRGHVEARLMMSLLSDHGFNPIWRNRSFFGRDYGFTIGVPSGESEAVNDLLARLVEEGKLELSAEPAGFSQAERTAQRNGLLLIPGAAVIALLLIWLLGHL